MMVHEQLVRFLRAVPAGIIALALGCSLSPSTGAPRPAETGISSVMMADKQRWTSVNLNLTVDGSYCYDDAEQNCRRYGRLYTWEAAGRACRAAGKGWRLPTDEEWRTLARHYGGVSEQSADSGRRAFRELSAGGSAGFNALLGGGRGAG